MFFFLYLFALVRLLLLSNIYTFTLNQSQPFRHTYSFTTDQTSLPERSSTFIYNSSLTHLPLHITAQHPVNLSFIFHYDSLIYIITQVSITSSYIIYQSSLIRIHTPSATSQNCQFFYYSHHRNSFMLCHILTPAPITPPMLVHPRAFLRPSPRASKKSHLFYCPQLPDFTFSYHTTPPPRLPLSSDGPNSPCRPEGDKGRGEKSAKLEMITD